MALIFKKLRKRVFLRFLLIVGTSLFLCFVFILYSHSASLFVSTFFFRSIGHPRDVSYKESQGTFSKKLSFHDLLFVDVDWFVMPNSLAIQEVSVTRRFPFNFSTELRNVRLKCGKSNPLIMNAVIQNGVVNGTVSFFQVHIEDIIKELKANKFLIAYKPTFDEGELSIVGTVRKARVTGFVTLDDAATKDVRVRTIRSKVNLDISRSDDLFHIVGDISIVSGRIIIRDTTELAIERAQLYFDDTFDEPRLSCTFTSKVGGVRITVYMSGSVKNPEVRLTSDSGKPEQILLLMLLTGKEWKGVDALYEKDTLSRGIAIDFVDFLFFGGKVSRLVKRLGIDDISVSADSETIGVEVRKSLSPQADVSYRLEQQTQADTESRLSQKVGASVNITDAVSIRGEKGIEKNKDGKTDDALLLKLKKSF
jgi:hypothetical protein